MVYLVYKTDAHHSYASRDIIGIATHPARAIDICEAQANKEGETLNEAQMFNLNNIEQTQGYSGDGEFQFESVETDTLL